ncbi:MAG: hypothetical protein R2731_19925 [Nocardioides sp.]
MPIPSPLLLALLAAEEDGPPDPKDVVAGPWGAVVTIGLIAATVFLLWNFTKQLKKAQAAKDAGVFGDEPVDRTADEPEPDGPVDDADARASGE